ncbi:MAG: ATP-dependent helicase C-terminal domain-containing protein, partial [Caulobacteraceae bacterium]
RLARLPLPPRLAHMVVEGARQGAGVRAAYIAAVLTERGLGGSAVDLTDRLERFAADRSPRTRDAQNLARRWAKLAGTGAEAQAPLSDGLLLALAYPERIARARGGLGEFRLASGRGAHLDPGDRLARETWLAIGELGGASARDRILLAAPVEETALLESFADQIVEEDRVEMDAAGRVRARRIRRLGELVVEDRPIERPDPDLLVRMLLARVGEEGLGALNWTDSARRWRERVGFLRGLAPDVWPDLSDAALLASLEKWLAPLLHGRSALAQIPGEALEQVLREQVPWELHSRMALDAPERFTVPTGSNILIDYAAEGGPRLEVRVQELFGLDRHPTIAGGRAPLTLSLLSPARRPVQVTRDLPGFWAGSWKAVRSEMRGRYPRHPWPDNPLEAPPTNRVKPRGT